MKRVYVWKEKEKAASKRKGVRNIMWSRVYS